jgi:hypothetical protein
MPPDELIPSNRDELSRRGDGVNPITSKMAHDLLARSNETLDEIIAEAIDWLNTFRQGGSKRGQTLNLNISLSFASVIRMSECHASSVLSILGRFIM